jgi:hypothetical protein
MAFRFLKLFVFSLICFVTAKELLHGFQLSAAMQPLVDQAQAPAILAKRMPFLSTAGYRNVYEVDH